MSKELQATIEAMVQPGRGILAADESGPTIAQRFVRARQSSALSSSTLAVPRATGVAQQSLAQ